jgi:hypothetical protein
MATNNPNTVNDTMERRRDERDSGQNAQVLRERVSDLSQSMLEVWQHQLALGEQVAKMWAHTFMTLQHEINRSQQRPGL